MKQAEYVEGYRLWLRFSDGNAGIVDLAQELWGPVFEPLKDQNTFRQVRVHPELETITWPNGADFAPEFLYEHLACRQDVPADRGRPSFVAGD